MIVCVCHRVSDRDIERHVHQGCSTFEQLQADLHVATNCGRCADCAMDTFDDAVRARRAAAHAAAHRESKPAFPPFPIGLVPAV
jgi:bacterioferritin-associated ferredoxin